MPHLDDNPLHDLDGKPGLPQEQAPPAGGPPAGQAKPGKGEVVIAPLQPVAQADPPTGGIVVKN